MALRDILVHLAADKRSSARAAVAVSLAAKHGAHATAIYVVDQVMVPTYIEAEIGRAVIERQQAALQQRGDEAGKAFAQLCERQGVKGEWRRVDGPAAEALTLPSRYADLTVISQDDPDDPGPADGLAEALLFSSGRPLLVTPYAGEHSNAGNRVMLAWNASREATRAAHDALPLLVAAKEVVIYGVNPSGARHIPGADIATHLARHGVKAKAGHVVADDLGVGDALLSALADNECDMLVMGGYGHSRLRELVLGGATRQVLASMTVPVVMSH